MFQTSCLEKHLSLGCTTRSSRKNSTVVSHRSRMAERQTNETDAEFLSAPQEPRQRDQFNVGSVSNQVHYLYHSQVVFGPFRGQARIQRRSNRGRCNHVSNYNRTTVEIVDDGGRKRNRRTKKGKRNLRFSFILLNLLFI